jgi:hypothetical protein
MDFIKSLMDRGNRVYLETLAEEYFPYSEEDTGKDREILDEFRDDFISMYDKTNNRQFTMTKKYLIPKYKRVIGDTFERSQ